MNALTILQGISSKKLIMVMWVIYMVGGVAEKQPEKGVICVGVMAGLAAVFLACQTALDWRRGPAGKGDPDDTVVPEIK